MSIAVGSIVDVPLPRRGTHHRVRLGTDLPYPVGVPAEPEVDEVIIRHRVDGTVELITRPRACPSAASSARALFETGRLTLDGPEAWAEFAARLSSPPTTPACEGGLGDPAYAATVIALARPPEIIGEEQLTAVLQRRVIGQPGPLRRLASGVAFHLRKTRPRTCYSALLIGPSGVGKTEVALALADELGGAWRSVQIDCGEITGRDQLNRVLGAAPGYVGHDRGSPLHHAFAQGRAVVVFDEVEKADPALLDAVLLSLLDRGRVGVPDAGRGEPTVLDARRSVVLFTSNLGAADLTQSMDDRAGRAHLRRHGLRPELVGRIGDVITFAALTDEALVAVAIRTVEVVLAEFDLRLGALRPNLLAALLASADRPSGVRGLQVALEARLRAPLSRHLDRGGSTDRLDLGLDHCGELELRAIPRRGDK